MLSHEDFSVVVKNRADPPKQWRWEIYRAGRRSPIARSEDSFTTVTEASRAGDKALGVLLSECPEWRWCSDCSWRHIGYFRVMGGGFFSGRAQASVVWEF